MSAVVTARGLGKQYRRRWALRDCTLEIPAGRVTGLVGPNGAGKTTLLSLAVGLLAPDRRDHRGLRRSARRRRRPAGQGRLRRPGHPDLRRAHASPSTCGSGAHLNPRWDDAAARRRIDRLGLDPDAEGRPALRRSAGPARPHPRARQAAGAAHPRRAGRQPRPAGPARVPPGADGGGRRGRDQRAALLARRLRPRAGLRPRRRPRRLPGAGGGRRRRPARHPPPADRPAPRPRLAARRPARRLGQPHRPPVHLRRPHRGARPRPGLVDHAAGPRGPRAGLHGGRRLRRHRRAPRWRCSDDLADLAAAARCPSPWSTRWSPPPASWLALTGPELARLARTTDDLSTSSPPPTGCSTTAASRCSRWRRRCSGVFWGAPLVARELESGTYRLAWNQSVTRGRWLATKLVVSVARDRRRGRHPHAPRSPGGRSRSTASRATSAAASPRA